MNAKADNLLNKMKRAPAAGYSPDEVKIVLSSYGFRVREGKRTFYQHPTYPDLFLVVPREPKLKPWVTREVTRLIRELLHKPLIQ